jgi:hypothetical protein
MEIMDTTNTETTAIAIAIAPFGLVFQRVPSIHTGRHIDPIGILLITHAGNPGS